MNKLDAVNFGALISKLEISKFENKDQTSVIDNILLCDKIYDEGKAKVNELINTMSEQDAIQTVNQSALSDEIEFKKISKKSFELIMNQENIDAGAKAIIYREMVLDDSK